MNDLPRQKLIEIVSNRKIVPARFGQDSTSDAKLYGALLRDLCGEHKREISVLVAAAEERVPYDLQTMQLNTPLDVLLTRLTQRLVDDRALAEDAARWAVESWALALGLKLPQAAVTAAPSKPAPIVVSAMPTPRSPAHMVSNAPYVFACTWQVEVLSRAVGNAQAEWKKIGETPGQVTVPAGYQVGLRPQGVGGEALAIWISELQDPTAIQWLGLGQHDVSDAGLKPLRVFTNLTRLDIAKADKVTDAGLACLGAFPKLTHLQVGGALAWQITGKGMVHLKNLTALTDLDLHGTGVTDDGFEHLGSLVHLVNLNLNSTSITGAALARLQGLASLTSLKLQWCKGITDAGLAHLRGLTGLTSLNLDTTKITDAGLVHLRGFTNLTNLNLHWCRGITDAGLVHLRGLTNLTDLNLGECSITDAGLVHLRGLTNLTHLSLYMCQKITDAGLVHLRALTNLKNLDIRGCSKITQKGRVAQRPGLEVVAW